tara:strand:+ start:28 stop:432 length:405 start_codon:yes stop_codon:yes gene_type:complete
MSSKSSVLKLFNNHLLEFIDDVILIFPDDINIKTGKTVLEGLKKVNPKSIIVSWYECITLVYNKEIEQGDFNFFENKDYAEDINNRNISGHSNNKVLQAINDIKIKVKTTSDSNKNKTMKYIQNLTKMSKLYFN